MKTQASTLTIGIDLGDRKHAICVLEEAGEPLKESTITNTRESLATLSEHPSRTLNPKYAGKLPRA